MRQPPLTLIFTDLFLGKKKYFFLFSRHQLQHTSGESLHTRALGFTNRRLRTRSNRDVDPKIGCRCPATSRFLACPPPPFARIFFLLRSYSGVCLLVNLIDTSCSSIFTWRPESVVVLCRAALDLPPDHNVIGVQ